MQALLEFYEKYKLEIRNVFLALVALFAAIYGGYQAGQEAPSPAAVEQALAARVSATPAPGRPGTVTPVPPTPTKKPVTATNLPPAFTATPTLPGATVTPAPTGVGGCPVHLNEWHEAVNETCGHHHHGVDPRAYAAVFDVNGQFSLIAFLDEHGELFQEKWLSSPLEDRRGMIWLYVENPTCDQSGAGPLQDPSQWDCATNALYRIHDVGTTDHALNRQHSEALIIKGCEKKANGLPDMSQCGVLAFPGNLAEYGPVHAPYKDFLCLLENTPKTLAGVVFPQSEIDQPPYIALQTRLSNDGGLQQYWVRTNPNATIAQYYPHNPNALFESAWLTLNAWQIMDPAICGKGDSLAVSKEKAAAFLPVPGSVHNKFQVVDLVINPHPPGPFNGFIDIWGHVFPEGFCVIATETCVPLVITSGFPDGMVAMRRDAFFRGDCSKIPCLIFDNGVPLLFPPLDVP